MSTLSKMLPELTSIHWPFAWEKSSEYIKTSRPRKDTSQIFSFVIKIFYLFTFRRRAREGARERERKRQRNTDVSIDRLPLVWPQMGTWPTTQLCALTRNRTGVLLVHRVAHNPLSHTSQGPRYFPFPCYISQELNTSLFFPC